MATRKAAQKKPTRRTEHVRIRLVPAEEGHAQEVTLYTAERAALEEAMRAAGFDSGLSSLIRWIGTQAAVDEHGNPLPGNTVAERIEQAAALSHQSVGEWLRTVCLAAVQAIPLRAQLVAAERAALALERAGE